MAECIFCKIIKKEVPSVILFEDETCLVILDKFPASKGQTLVISKKHEPYVFNLNETDYLHMFEMAKNMVKAIDKSFDPLRTCLVIEGFEVPHSHIKLFPSYHTKLNMKGFEASNEELQVVANDIKKNL